MLQALGILAAGCAAGALNVVVGSGTLITFPVLLAFGYAPVVANVSNTIGLVPGSLAGAIGYRRELEGQGRRVRRLACATALRDCYHRTYRSGTYVWTKPFGKERDHEERDE